jgi:hypothetical protein
MGFTVRILLDTDVRDNSLMPHYKRSLYRRRLPPFLGLPGAAIVVMGIVLADPIVAILTTKSPELRGIDLHAK